MRGARAQLASILSIASTGLPCRYWSPQAVEPKLGPSGTSAQLWFTECQEDPGRGYMKAPRIDSGRAAAEYLPCASRCCGPRG